MRKLRLVARSLFRNAWQAVPTIFVIVTLGFFLMQLAPGDAAEFMAAESGAATEEVIAIFRERFGLDLPLLTQLTNYYGELAHFSLGNSVRYGRPVAELIWQRLPATILLMGTALVIAAFLGLLFGTVMALTAGRLPDRILSVVSLVFYSVPSFWIGLMLIILFSVKLGWLPTGGAQTIGLQATGYDYWLDRARYFCLPALSLGLYYVALYSRLTRASVLEAKSFDYVKTAIAKGLSPSKVIRRHVLRNALIPITTLTNMHVAGMLGGAVVIETVFSWPGMGRLAYEAILARENTVLLGILIASSLTVIVVNALFDIIQSLIDPRVEVR
ncbi:ABC transporter permease [Rhizobium rhizogenes]|uniref:ABC transporter permease n=1 Tax=Rhizobium rhizogenes TaxID=359 RepID=UPI00157190E1|nr:ABC transporter permease [Rhizobium rhizogenes]NTI78661.1 ABC transporter permease [Rhizobium rhizogenes]